MNDIQRSYVNAQYPLQKAQAAYARLARVRRWLGESYDAVMDAWPRDWEEEAEQES